MFKTRKSMIKTINNLQDKKKELENNLNLLDFELNEYRKLKNRYEKVMSTLEEIETLSSQNTYDRADIILSKINELSQTANQR